MSTASPPYGEIHKGTFVLHTRETGDVEIESGKVYLVRTIWSVAGKGEEQFPHGIATAIFSVQEPRFPNAAMATRTVYVTRPVYTPAGEFTHGENVDHSSNWMDEDAILSIVRA